MIGYCTKNDLIHAKRSKSVSSLPIPLARTDKAAAVITLLPHRDGVGVGYLVPRLRCGGDSCCHIFDIAPIPDLRRKCLHVDRITADQATRKSPSSTLGTAIISFCWLLLAGAGGAMQLKGDWVRHVFHKMYVCKFR